MLILTRKVGTSIKIGQDIDVRILKIGESSSAVSIGISAPKSIKVVRAELQSPENARDAGDAPTDLSDP